RCTSSCNSVVMSSSRVCAIVSIVCSKLPSDLKRPVAGPPAEGSPNWPCCSTLMVWASAAPSPPTHEQSDDNADPGGNAQRLPWVFADVILRSAGRMSCLLQRILLDITDARFGDPQ